MSTRLRARRLSFRGSEFLPVRAAPALRALIDLGGGILEQHHAGGTVRVTTLERALVDVFDHTDTLRATRERKGISQRALSAMLGIPQSGISRIENGAVDVRTSSLLALSRALDLEPVLVPRRLVPAVTRIIEDALASSGTQPKNRPLYRLDDSDDDA